MNTKIITSGLIAILFLVGLASAVPTPTPKTPNAAIVIEDALVNNVEITVVHHGGDAIVDAFTSGAADWNNLMVTHNGADITWSSSVTEGGDADANFESGEQLKIIVPALASGDTISVGYIPTGDILQRVKVASASSPTPTPTPMHVVTPIVSPTVKPTTPTPTLPEVTPALIDSDGDGWSDEFERKAGTNPHAKDTDNDGLWDPQDPNPLVPQKTGIPGFEIIFAFAGLLAVAYLIRRKVY
ncbi:hypothetical protein ES705_08065 [subsurface metagenome]|nr:PGF-CTERM sorting domain-containing protein [Methanosarcinales archaeon]